jgi:hypothetical protein
MGDAGDRRVGDVHPALLVRRGVQLQCRSMPVPKLMTTRTTPAVAAPVPHAQLIEDRWRMSQAATLSFAPFAFNSGTCSR